MFRPILRMAAAVALASVAGTGSAQFATPTVNAAVAAGEYGNHTDGVNQFTNGGQTWFLTWDDTNLYAAITGGNVFEAAVLYIDHNPVTPNSGGTDANGTTAGFNYDNAKYLSVNLRADFVTYIKNGYREYRNADGANGWGGATSGFGSYADDTVQTREVAIPWSAITGGGRPASFKWFGYVVSGGGWVYGQAPSENPGTNAVGVDVTNATNHFTVANTANGVSSAPFGSSVVPVTVSGFSME